MHHDHDALFRHTFSQPEHAASLLRTILPPALANAIDWSTLQLAPGSFVDDDLKWRHTDLLFTARIGGDLVLFYVVLDHKSGSDRWTSLQLLRYMVRVYDRFRSDHAEATLLPPIVPIVVHHGDRAWSAPRTVLDLIDLDSLPPAVQAILSPLQPSLHFLLDDLATVPESQLRARRATLLARLTLLMLQFVRGAQEADPADFVRRWLDLLRAVWADPGARHTLLALFSYLAAHLETGRDKLGPAAALIHEDAQTMGKTIADQFREEGFQKAMTIADQFREEGFQKGLDQGVSRGVAQGVTQGVAEGKATGRAEMLLRLIQKRFGSVTPAVEARIRAASMDTLDRWAECVLTAATVDEVFE